MTTEIVRCGADGGFIAITDAMTPCCFSSLPETLPKNLEIVPLRKTFWWPHPLVPPRHLWKRLTVKFRYFVNGIETDKTGIPI